MIGGPPLPMQQLPGVIAGEASTPAGGSVFTSVDKLGLKLDARKAPAGGDRDRQPGKGPDRKLICEEEWAGPSIR